MRRNAVLVAVALAAGSTLGCVDRRYVIETEPPGAVVQRNGQAIGATPADDHFVYYGTYNFTITKDGYETKVVPQRIPAPWYQYPPFDFITENLIPWRIQDVRRFHYDLEPVKSPQVEQILGPATNLRERGKGVQLPEPRNP